MKKLKRLGIISLTALSVFAVSACGNDDNSPDASTSGSGRIAESSVAQASGSSADTSSEAYQIQELDNIQDLLDTYLSGVLNVETTTKNKDGNVKDTTKAQAKFDKETGNFSYYSKNQHNHYSAYKPDGATESVSYLKETDLSYAYNDNNEVYKYSNEKYFKNNGELDYNKYLYDINNIPADALATAKSVLTYDYTKINSILNSTANLLIGENGLVSKAYSYVTTILSKYLKPVNDATVEGVQYKLDTASLKADLTALNGKAVTDYITAFLGEDALTDLLSTLKTFLTQDDIFELFTIAKNAIAYSNVSLPEKAQMAITLINGINTKEDLSNLLDSVLPTLLKLVKPTIKADILAMIEAIDFTVTVDENLYTINFEIPQFASLQATVENKENEFNATAKLVAPMMGSYDVTYNFKNENGVISYEYDINMEPANVLKADTEGEKAETVKENMHYMYVLDTVNRTINIESKTPVRELVASVDNSNENEVKGTATMTSNYTYYDSYKDSETGETKVNEINITNIDKINFDLTKTENGYNISFEKLSKGTNDYAVAVPTEIALTADKEVELDLDLSLDLSITKDEINFELINNDSTSNVNTFKITRADDFDAEFVKEVKDSVIKPIDKFKSIDLSDYKVDDNGIVLNYDYSITCIKMYDYDGYYSDGFLFDIDGVTLSTVSGLYVDKYGNFEVTYDLPNPSAYYKYFYFNSVGSVYVLVNIDANGKLDFSTVKFYSDHGFENEIEKPIEFTEEKTRTVEEYYKEYSNHNFTYYVSFASNVK